MKFARQAPLVSAGWRRVDEFPIGEKGKMIVSSHDDVDSDKIWCRDVLLKEAIASRERCSA
jgi:hypothetical protein